jgi:Adenylate and Guanylate cyclase catalytic domain
VPALLSLRIRYRFQKLVRDPFQVFTLLESIYGAFDKVAERRRVFKVETIGDCYVAGRALFVLHSYH